MITPAGGSAQERSDEMLELKHLVLTLSELLDSALDTRGEMREGEWERLEVTQRKSELVRHPEIFNRKEAEAVIQVRDTVHELLSAAKDLLLWRRDYGTADRLDSYLDVLAVAVKRAEGRG